MGAGSWGPRPSRPGDHLPLLGHHAIVSQYAGRVVVANSLQVKAIAHAKIKTDKVDAYTLARLLQADFLPSVELPDEKTWALRQLVSHRRLLIKQRVAIKNTVLAVFSSS